MNKFSLLALSAFCSLSAFADWGSFENPVKIFPTNTKSYGINVKACPDGGAWAVNYFPNIENASSESDIDNVIYEYRVQHWDKDGNPSFDENGLLISDFPNLSFTVETEYLSVDSEGNAILAVSDGRNSQNKELSLTVYRISPSGEMLWGEEGCPLDDPTKPANLIAMNSCVQLEDGSFVFAWLRANDFDGTQDVYLQRLDKNGNKLWDSDKVSLLGDQCSNPYLIPAGDNMCILVYSRTASQVVYARKLDFEGSNVWGKDTRVYRGGWGGIPIHTLISVTPSGDGGALISWNDDRYNTLYECPYLSYITPDGKIGFSSASEEGDVKLDYEGWRCFQVKAAPAADGSAFYAMWSFSNLGQSSYGLKVQKLNRQGELLWGDNGLVIEPKADQQISFNFMESAGDDNFVIFYEINREYFDRQCFASRLDSDGNMVWPENKIALSKENRQASSFEVTPIPGNDAWFYFWKDKDSNSKGEGTYMLGRLSADGTIGSEKSLVTDIYPNSNIISFDGTNLYAEGQNVKVFTPSGCIVADKPIINGSANISLENGIYLVTIDNNQSFKLTFKK